MNHEGGVKKRVKIKTAADYLKAMHWINVRIDSTKERIDYLEKMAGSISGVSYEKDRVIASAPKEAGFENQIVNLAMLKAEMKKNIDDLAEMYDKGMEIIQSLQNPIDQTILSMFYIDHKTIPTIAKKMHYSQSNIYYRKKHAMDRLKKKSL